jgi:NAD(P)-dependent dehydrogenase (short-subunit alcohol dehydrogenase family)
MSRHDSHNGEIAVVTGASSGIGLETASELATLGYEDVLKQHGPARSAAGDDCLARQGGL